MSKAQFLNRLSEILEVPAGSLTGEEKLSDLEEWNSLSMISFIAMGDEEFQKSLSPRQFATCHTVNDLGALVGIES